MFDTWLDMNTQAVWRNIFETFNANPDAEDFSDDANGGHRGAHTFDRRYR